MTDYLERLNPAQRAAATAAALVLVLASAGSGKTETLIRRVSMTASSRFAPTWQQRSTGWQLRMQRSEGSATSSLGKIDCRRINCLAVAKLCATVITEGYGGDHANG